MIIEPTSSEKFRGSDGQVWVSTSWIRKQTGAPSTNGWTEGVMYYVKDTLGGPWKMHKGEAYYRLEDIREAFKHART